MQHVFHSLFRSIADDPRACRVIAIFRRIADGIAHLGHAAFVHEVYDHLHFVERFKIGDFRLVACFAQRFEPVGNELADTAAENGLFAEEVCFCFFLEGRLDDAGTGAADAAGISQGDVKGPAGSILFDGKDVGDTTAFDELAAYDVARPFGSDHEYIDIIGRDNLFEVDIKAVGKSQGTARSEVVPDFVFIYVGLFFIGNENHGDIRSGDGFGDSLDCKTGLTGFFRRFTAAVEADSDIDAAVAEIERMGMALAAVTDDSDFLSFDSFPINILIIKYLCHTKFPLDTFVGFRIKKIRPL